MFWKFEPFWNKCDPCLKQFGGPKPVRNHGPQHRNKCFLCGFFIYLLFWGCVPKSSKKMLMIVFFQCMLLVYLLLWLNSANLKFIVNQFRVFASDNFNAKPTSVTLEQACTAKTMRQESIHYSKLGEKNVEFLQQSRKTPNQLGKFTGKLDSTTK